MKRYVALVGFMAAGKSTAGKKLARKLQCAFHDCDELVEGRYGPIADIFDNEGEAMFRRYEREALEELLDGDGSGIVALGGGALELAENRRLLAKRAYRVFIRISPEQALRRVRANKQIRPLLGPSPSLARIASLYERRMEHYGHADHVVQADTMDPGQVVDDILAWLHRKKISF